LFKKYNVGFVSASGVAGVVGGLAVVGAGPGSLPLGAAVPAVDAGAAAPAVFVGFGLFDDVVGTDGIDAGVEVDGLVVVFVAALPAALCVFAAVGGDAAAPAVTAESLGEFGSLLQLMAARSPVPISQDRIAMLTS